MAQYYVTDWSAIISNNNFVKVLDTLDFTTEKIKFGDLVPISLGSPEKFINLKNTFQNVEFRNDFYQDVELPFNGYIKVSNEGDCIEIYYKGIRNVFYLIEINSIWFVCYNNIILYCYGHSSFDYSFMLSSDGLFVENNMFVIRLKRYLGGSLDNYFDILINIATGVVLNRVYSDGKVRQQDYLSHIQDILEYPAESRSLFVLQYFVKSNASYHKHFYRAVEKCYKLGIFNINDVRLFIKNLQIYFNENVDTKYMLDSLVELQKVISELSKDDILFATKLHFLYGGK